MSPQSRPQLLLAAARATKGFMPDEEGLALAAVARRAVMAGFSSIVEVGAYCGRSTLYLASGTAQAMDAGAPPALIFSVDHHHGSEENQPGWEHHDATLLDRETGRIDTLPFWRRALESAGAEDLAVAVVGDSPAIAARWNVTAGLVFIDGGHGEVPAWADYRGWAPRVAEGGWLAIHDVFPDPRDGGRPPFEIYKRALSGGEFVEEASAGIGSLRVLRREVGASVGSRSRPRGSDPSTNS
ncbi:MAG: class I SAM-dependent methyltransferase [Acidimicrobiales bacterium]|jgi:predicted O-methyltransferase YrrM